MVTTITGRYESFTDLGAACLEAVARRRDRPIGRAERDRLRHAMAGLPPHPDVPAALGTLREHG